jgi:hypothetical protein
LPIHFDSLIVSVNSSGIRFAKRLLFTHSSFSIAIEPKSLADSQRSSGNLAGELLQFQERRSVLGNDLLNVRIELKKRNATIAELIETVKMQKHQESDLCDA